MLPALLWLVFAALIVLLAWRWLRSMDTDLSRVLVVLVYMSYRVALQYPASPGTP